MGGFSRNQECTYLQKGLFTVLRHPIRSLSEMFMYSIGVSGLGDQDSVFVDESSVSCLGFRTLCFWISLTTGLGFAVCFFSN